MFNIFGDNCFFSNIKERNQVKSGSHVMKRTVHPEIIIIPLLHPHVVPISQAIKLSLIFKTQI